MITGAVAFAFIGMVIMGTAWLVLVGLYRLYDWADDQQMKVLKTVLIFAGACLFAGIATASFSVLHNNGQIEIYLRALFSAPI